MVLEKYYENLKALHVGTMANRCYYVPLSENGENRSMQLSGEDWKFAYFPCVEEVPDGFFEENSIRRDLRKWRCLDAGR